MSEFLKEINNLAYKLELTNKIAGFIKANSEEDCLSLLKKIQKRQKYLVEKGLQEENNASLWRKYVTAFVKAKSESEREERTAREADEIRIEHEASKERGFKATFWQILALLQENFQARRLVSEVRPGEKEDGRRVWKIPTLEVEREAGYRGLCGLFDREVILAELESDYADGRVDAKVYEERLIDLTTVFSRPAQGPLAGALTEVLVKEEV